MQDVICPFDYL